MDEWKLRPASDVGLAAGERWRSVSRESGLLETGGHLIWWGFLRGFLRLYHRLEVHGRENLPQQPPFVLVANHASHLDAPALAAPFPWPLRDRIFLIAAGDMFFETPSRAAFAAYALNALPVWRRQGGPHALQSLRERLIGEPCAFVLFPEGTRARDGQIARFKPGLGMLVCGTGVPVVPCHLRGTFQAMPPGTHIPRPAKIIVRLGSPLCFGGVENDRQGWTTIAGAAEQAVRALEKTAL